MKYHFIIGNKKDIIDHMEKKFIEEEIVKIKEMAECIEEELKP